MEIESSVLYTMSKIFSASENCGPTKSQSIHHLQTRCEQRYIYPRFQQSPNELHTKQNSETQKHDKLYRNDRRQQQEQQQNQLEKLFIANLNVNLTIDNIYELFDLKTTKYLRSNTYVKMLLNRDDQTRGFAFVTGPDHVRNEPLKLNNI